jgi:hypothetical protein
MDKQIPPLQRHHNHPVVIGSHKSGPHTAKMSCVKCNKFVSWMKQSDLDFYREHINKPVVLSELQRILRAHKFGLLD